jgi:3-phenylpropionate/trans-cinnamate dioxygenase ferredoxin reductase component
MLETHYQYVLLGGGLASGAAAEQIRLHDPAGSILLVGQEVNRPYHRPRLNTTYLSVGRGRTEIVAQAPSWFADHQITLSTGRRAANLDTPRRTVTLDSGEEIAFDKLLIATGASARPLSVPGAHLPNVFTLRSVDDADRLHNAIEKAKAEGLRHESGRGVAAVVGAGPLGIELTATLVQLGLAVELIVGSAYPLRKYAGEYTGKVIAQQLTKRGVRLHLGHRPHELQGDGRAQRVLLSDGTSIPCDFVVGAIGVTPNKDILHGTPITSEKAILVDEHCQTSVPGIFAAGDCAAVLDPLFGKHRLIDHWENAQLTGRIAGANMAGADERYNVVNRFRTRIFDLEIVGFGEPRLVDRRHIRGNESVESPDFIEIGVAADGRIAQVLAVGHSGEDVALEQLVRDRVNVEGREEALKDPGQPLV